MNLKSGFLAFFVIFALLFSTCGLFSDDDNNGYNNGGIDNGDNNSGDNNNGNNGGNNIPPGAERIVGLVMVVDFPEERTKHTIQEVHDLFNRVGGIEGGRVRGSVYDYFLEVSNNQFAYTNIVVPVVVTLPNAKSFYDQPLNNQPGPNRRANMTVLITDAFNVLNSMGIDLDLSELTIATNGAVRAFNIFYAGEGYGNFASFYDGDITVNGVRFYRYQATGLLDHGNNPDLSNRLGTVLHENGHSIFNWPDLYCHGDLNIPSRSVGLWCLMGAWPSGNRNRHTPNPYFRHLAGWIDVIDIANAAPGTEFTIEMNSHKAFVYRRNDQEAFFIEARRRDDNFNSTLPGEGLAIWHIHSGGNNLNTDIGFPRVALVQADGRDDLANRTITDAGRLNNGDDTDLFRLGVNTVFNSSTTPAAIYHDGTPSGINITNISDIGAVMTFTIGESHGPTDPTYRFYSQAASYPEARGHIEIEVSQGFTLNSTLTINNPQTAGATLTIRSANPAAPVTLTRGVSGNLFTIQDGATLILENIIIDGDSNGNFAETGGGSLVRINSGGALVMNAGAVARNNVNSVTGGTVHNRVGSTFTMNGGEISGNIATANAGAGVRVEGTFIMNGGKISGNTTNNNVGGGVYVDSSIAFTMTGGEISGNNASHSGGGISVNSEFIMNGGKISENTSSASGGAVEVRPNAKFTMNDGEISENTAATDGGGIRVSNNGQFVFNEGKIIGNTAIQHAGGVFATGAGSIFTMNGGEISGNTSGGEGGGVRVNSGITFTMTNGEISGNIAGSTGGGVRVATNTTTFIMQGGKIAGNIAGTDGGGVNMGGLSFTMTGGEISGNTAARGNGIHRAGGEVNLNSGVVAGTGTNIAAVVFGAHNLNTGDSPSPNNALIIVWNKPVGDGPFDYTAGENTHLTVSPANATAVWGIHNGKLGIVYANSGNDGFIEIW
jgi:M6 family metalloprotease-like protein